MANYVKQFWGPGKYTVLADSNILDWEFTTKSLREICDPLLTTKWHNHDWKRGVPYIEKSKTESVNIANITPTSFSQMEVFGGIDGFAENYTVSGDCTDKTKGYFTFIESAGFRYEANDGDKIFSQNLGGEPHRLDVLYKPGPSSSVQIEVDFSGHSPGRVLRRLALAYEQRLSEYKSASMTKQSNLHPISGSQASYLRERSR